MGLVELGGRCGLAVSLHVAPQQPLAPTALSPVHPKAAQKRCQVVFGFGMSSLCYASQLEKRLQEEDLFEFTVQMASRVSLVSVFIVWSHMPHIYVKLQSAPLRATNTP